MKKTSIALLLSTTMFASVLTGCSLNTDKINDIISIINDDGDNAEGDSDSKNDKSDGKDADNSNNNGEAVGNPSVVEDEIIQVIVGQNLLSEYSQDYEMDKCYARYPIISLGIEEKNGYSKLQKALESLDLQIKNKVIEDYYDALAYADGCINNGYFMGTFYIKERAFVRRADAIATSILIYHNEYTGGAHEFYGYGGYNYDSQTGEKISFYDVVKDKDKFMDVIRNEIATYYSDYEVPYAIDEESFSSLFSKENIDDLSWTLDNNGVTVYFTPGMLGAWADGAQVVTVSAAKYTDVLNAGYFTDNEYIIEIPNDMPIYADINDDGELERISTSYYFEAHDEIDQYYLSNYYVYEGMTNNYSISVNYNTVQAETYAYDFKVYYVHTSSKDYIYTLGDRDMSTLWEYYEVNMKGPSYICNDYDINMEYYEEFDKQQDRFYGYRYVLLDPKEIKGFVRCNLFSEFGGNCELYVDKSGMIKRYDEYIYNTVDYSEDYMKDVYTFTCTSPINIEIIDEDGTSKGYDYALKPGDVIKYYRTNTTDVADFIIPTGELGRFYMDDYMISTVNDYPDAYFDGVWHN